MRQMAKVAPPNSLVFISDSSGGEAPAPVWGAQILATASCVSIACYPEIEGKTEIVLSRADEVDPGDVADFDEVVETSRKDLVISTVDGEPILETDVPTTATRVRIWRSEPKWPRKILVGWG